MHCLLKCKSRVFRHELQRIGKINQSFCCLFAASWKIGSNGEMAWMQVEWNGWKTQAFCSGKLFSAKLALWNFISLKFLNCSQRIESFFLPESFTRNPKCFTFNFVAVELATYLLGFIFLRKTSGTQIKVSANFFNLQSNFNGIWTGKDLEATLEPKF